MRPIADFLVIFVAVLHMCFLIIEMFLWQKPLGLKIFRNSLEKAKLTSVLAANQGLYNGFLSVGLLVGYFVPNPAVSQAFTMYFLACAVIAGIYGAWSVSRRILFVQALPAALALVLLV